MKLEELIKSLPEHNIPKNYKWDRTCGVLLKDIGFIHVQDLLHKKHFKQVNPFPDKFNEARFFRRNALKKIKKFIHIDPEHFVMAQSHLDKKHLLELLKKPNKSSVRIIKCGRYYVVCDGHHRVALKYLKGQRVYATITVLE